MKNVIKLISGLVLTLILVVSCKKDKVEEPITPVNSIEVGNYDNSYNHEVLSSPMILFPNWDAQNLYGYDQDSLDIDQDGSYDLTFRLAMLNPDSIHLLQGNYPNPFPNLSVTPNNSFEIAYTTENYYGGMGAVYAFHWAEFLMQNDAISENHDWWNSFIHMWSENPLGGSVSYGPWYSVSDTGYVAIKQNNKLGWIKIDATVHDTVKVLEYAIQQ